MKVCRRGHEFRGDENYRARRGWCPVCFHEVQRRYNKSEKGRARNASYGATDKCRARHTSYNDSEKGAERQSRYWQSPRGWKQRLNDRRRLALDRRKQRQEAEDLG